MLKSHPVKWACVVPRLKTLMSKWQLKRAEDTNGEDVQEDEQEQKNEIC